MGENRGDAYSSYRNFSTEVHCNYLMLSGSELPEEDFQHIVSLL